MSTISIRLNKQLEERLQKASQQQGRRRSDVVRDALERVLPSLDEPLTAQERYERVKHLIGAVDSGTDDLGTNHRQHLRRALDARRDDIMGRGAADRAD